MEKLCVWLFLPVTQGGVVGRAHGDANGPRLQEDILQVVCFGRMNEGTGQATNDGEGTIAVIAAAIDVAIGHGGLLLFVGVHKMSFACSSSRLQLDTR